MTTRRAGCGPGFLRGDEGGYLQYNAANNFPKEDVMVTCPNQECARQLAAEIDGYNATVGNGTGLHPVRCVHCGHAGFVAGGGLHLVFRTGQEFCFTVGTTPAQLTMLIPAEALGAYQWLDLAQEALARYAAEWVLLLGHQAGTFTLRPEKLPFAGFTRYVEDRMPKFHPRVA
jgi:hypothetical protein